MYQACKSIPFVKEISEEQLILWAKLALNTDLGSQIDWHYTHCDACHEVLSHLLKDLFEQDKITEGEFGHWQAVDLIQVDMARLPKPTLSNETVKSILSMLQAEINKV